MNKALDDILAERDRQDKQWGKQNHDPFVWLAILGEEFGEVSKSLLQMYWFVLGKDMNDHGQFVDLRSELVQVSAVAMAAVEMLDRVYLEGEKLDGHARSLTERNYRAP